MSRKRPKNKRAEDAVPEEILAEGSGPTPDAEALAEAASQAFAGEPVGEDVLIEPAPEPVPESATARSKRGKRGKRREVVTSDEPQAEQEVVFEAPSSDDDDARIAGAGEPSEAAADMQAAPVDADADADADADTTADTEPTSGRRRKGKRGKRRGADADADTAAAEAVARDEDAPAHDDDTAAAIEAAALEDAMDDDEGDDSDESGEVAELEAAATDDEDDAAASDIHAASGDDDVLDSELGPELEEAQAEAEQLAATDERVLEDAAMRAEAEAELGTAEAEPEPGDEDVELSASLPTTAATMDDVKLRHLVEALVFASDKPLTLQRLRQLTRVSDVARLEAALDALAADFADRGIALQVVSGGYQFRTNTQFSQWVQQLIAGRPVRLSRAQLETLAIIAYRQPITRPEIDEIRGVDSAATLRLLMDRALIRILGKKEDVGRPILYGTTKEFLDFFSLNDLRELPTLREYSELTAESRKVMSERLGISVDASGADTIPEPPPDSDAALDDATLADAMDAMDAVDAMDAAGAMDATLDPDEAAAVAEAAEAAAAVEAAEAAEAAEADAESASADLAAMSARLRASSRPCRRSLTRWQVMPAPASTPVIRTPSISTAPPSRPSRLSTRARRSSSAKQQMRCASRVTRRRRPARMLMPTWARTRRTLWMSPRPMPTCARTRATTAR